MIHSLSLKNWRTHKNAFLEFGLGTNLIIGIMGSGKSGVLNGLSYALFGAFPALKRRELSAGDAISHGQEEAETEVVFEHKGKRYKVHRRLRNKGGKLSAAAKLYEGGNVLETGQVRVTESVSSILGMDYDLFTRAVYSEQNNIDYFLAIDPGRRKKEMDRLLGLDRFESARANSVSVLNRVSSEADSRSSVFNPEEYSLSKKEHEEKAKRLSSLEAQKKKSESGLIKIREMLAPLSRKVSILEETRKKQEAARAAFERSKARLEHLSSDLEGKEPSKEKLLGLKSKLASFSKEKESLNSEIRKLEKQASASTTQLGRLSTLIEYAKSSAEALSNLEKKLFAFGSAASLESIAKENEAKLVSLSSNIKSISNEIAELEDVSSALKPDHSECPLCGSELSAEKTAQILSEKKQELQSKKEELSSLKESLPTARKKFSQAMENMRRAQQLSDRITDLKSKSEKLPELETQKSEAENQLAGLKSMQDEFRSKREKIEPMYSEHLLQCREEESLLQKLDSFKLAEEENARAKAILGSIQFDESELENARKHLEETRVNEGRARANLEGLHKEHASLAEVISMLQKRISQMESAKKDFEYLSKLREELVIYKNSLVELQSELRAEMTSAISSAMNEIWPVLYPYADYKQIRITGTEKDYFFEVYDGEWRRLEKVASGGERACLSLTLRIALSTVLTPGVGWMMLDEPTHNLDRGAIHTLSEALENKVPEIIPQSIVITHEENLISSEFARSYKFSRDKESLGPTVVETI
jgi:DNA repair protein SbcC/Rad50